MMKPNQVKNLTQKIAEEVIAGKWGIGEQRQVRLTNAGYDYAKIMRKVEQLLKERHV